MAEQNRTHAVIDTTTRTAENVSNKLWFLDLKFEQFATPRLIGFVFFMWMILAALSVVGTVGYAFATMPVWLAALVIVADLVLSIISAILVRVSLEAFLVIFRIAEHLRHLKHLEIIAQAKSASSK